MIKIHVKIKCQSLNVIWAAFALLESLNGFCQQSDLYNITDVGVRMDVQYIYKSSPRQLKIAYERLGIKDTCFVNTVDRSFLNYVLVHEMNIVDPRERLRLRRMTRAFYNSFESRIDLTGSGLANFVSSQKNAYTIGATAAFGANLILSRNSNLSTVLTVTETRDTIRSQNPDAFGSSILVPGIRKFSILVNFRKFALFPTQYAVWNRFGFGIFANYTSLNWATDTYDSLKTDPITQKKVHDTTTVFKKVSPLVFEAYLSYKIADIRIGDNTGRVVLDFGLAFRYLGGDTMAPSIRQLFLPTDKIPPPTDNNKLLSQNNYWLGAHGGINIHVNDTKVYFYFSLIPKRTEPGLGGLQAFAGIGLTAKIASVKLP